MFYWLSARGRFADGCAQGGVDRALLRNVPNNCRHAARHEALPRIRVSLQAPPPCVLARQATGMSLHIPPRGGGSNSPAIRIHNATHHHTSNDHGSNGRHFDRSRVSKCLFFFRLRFCHLPVMSTNVSMKRVVRVGVHAVGQ